MESPGHAAGISGSFRRSGIDGLHVRRMLGIRLQSRGGSGRMSTRPEIAAVESTFKDPLTWRPLAGTTRLVHHRGSREPAPPLWDPFSTASPEGLHVRGGAKMDLIDFLPTPLSFKIAPIWTENWSPHPGKHGGLRMVRSKQRPQTIVPAS